MRHDIKIQCPKYLQFIREKPCAVCGKPPPSDADHLRARGFGSGKQNDLTGLPLCRRHHSERGQIGNVTFEVRHNIDLWQMVALYLIEFFVDTERRKTIEVHVSKKSKEVETLRL